MLTVWPYAFPTSLSRSSTGTHGLSVTLTTSPGDVDLPGKVAGGGTCEQLLPYTSDVEVFEVPVKCVTLERLIQLKRAAGRAEDLEMIA